MAFRLYIVPQVGTGASPEDARRPKYIADMVPQPFGEYWSFGFQPVFLAGVDVTPAQDTTIVANSDVFAFPFDLDTSITGGQVNAVKTTHEAFFIPADWMTGGLSWRQIARTDTGMFRYLQRLRGIIGNVILFDGTGNKTLNAQFSSLPIEIQNGIHAAAAYDNFTTAFITPTTQMRAILKNIADQSQGRSFVFAGIFVI